MRGVTNDSKLGAVERVAGRAAVSGGEGHEACVANANAERVAGALEACFQVGVLVAAVACEPPAFVLDGAAGSQAGYLG